MEHASTYESAASLLASTFATTVATLGFAAEAAAYGTGFAIDYAGAGLRLVEAAGDGVAGPSATAASIDIVIATTGIERGVLAAVVGNDLVLAVDAVADFGRAAVAARGPGKCSDGQQSKWHRC